MSVPTEWSEWREDVREWVRRRSRMALHALAVSPFRMGLVATEALAATLVAAYIVWLPLTTDLRPVLGLVLGLLVLTTILMPGSAAPVVLLMTLGGSYVLLSSIGDAFDGRLPPTVHVLGMAIGLFTVHSIDTYRTTVPPHVLVDRSVILRWLRRQLEAVVPTVLLGIVVLQAPARGLPRAWWFVGAAMAVLAVGIPAIRSRRSPWLDRKRPSDVRSIYG